jgi:glycoprotein-N-acetylgalactosamine 3-beta-galactosyltransferase
MTASSDRAWYCIFFSARSLLFYPSILLPQPGLYYVPVAHIGYLQHTVPYTHEEEIGIYLRISQNPEVLNMRRTFARRNERTRRRTLLLKRFLSRNLKVCLAFVMAIVLSSINFNFFERTKNNMTVADLLDIGHQEWNRDNTVQHKYTTHLLHKLIKPGNHTNIPHPEARIGPNGEKGYIHDPKYLINKPRQFRIRKEEEDALCTPPGNGTEGEKGTADLAMIRNHVETSQGNRNVKLFCAIYTYKNGENFTNAISETWGRKCDGLLYASDHSNAESGHVHIPSNSRHKFGYKGMIQRTRSILAYLYDNFLEDYDYFHLSGDDVYMIVENMKEFLASDRVREWDEVPDQYFFAGFWTHWGGAMEDGYFYLGGGSGYTLSKKSLKAYVEGPLQSCQPDKEGSEEDKIFTDCARNLTNIFIDTRDSSGAHRYHQQSISDHLNRIVKQSLKHMERPPISIPQHIWDKSAYTSNSSVAFHKHHFPHALRRMELLLYKNVTDECSK